MSHVQLFGVAALRCAIAPCLVLFLRPACARACALSKRPPPDLLASKRYANYGTKKSVQAILNILFDGLQRLEVGGLP